MTKTIHSSTKNSPAPEPDVGGACSADAPLAGATPELQTPQAEAFDQAISEVATAQTATGAEDQGPSQVEELKRQLAAAEDRVLRAYAELDNYRKRANRLLQEETKYAPLPLVRDLLPVVDNLERAIQSADQKGDSAKLLEGVKMIAQQLSGVLERHHCRPIEAKGAPFDPHVHEAITQIPSRELPPGTVAEVTLTGYQLHDRIVRPAQVLVSTRPPTDSPSGAASDEGEEDTVAEKQTVPEKQTVGG